MPAQPFAGLSLVAVFVPFPVRMVTVAPFFTWTYSAFRLVFERVSEMPRATESPPLAYVIVELLSHGTLEGTVHAAAAAFNVTIYRVQVAAPTGVEVR
jgi:hypothetical protein